MYKILSESKIGLMPTAVFAGGIAANIRLLKLLELVLLAYGLFSQYERYLLKKEKKCDL